MIFESESGGSGNHVYSYVSKVMVLRIFPQQKTEIF